MFQMHEVLENLYEGFKCMSDKKKCLIYKYSMILMDKKINYDKSFTTSFELLKPTENTKNNVTFLTAN